MPHHISLKGIVSSGWWRVTTQYKGLFERSPCNYIVHGWLYAGPLMHNESGMLLVCCNTSVGLRSYLSAGNRGTRIFVHDFMVTCLLKKRIVHNLYNMCPWRDVLDLRGLVGSSIRFTQSYQAWHAPFLYWNYKVIRFVAEVWADSAFTSVCTLHLFRRGPASCLIYKNICTYLKIGCQLMSLPVFHHDQCLLITQTEILCLTTATLRETCPAKLFAIKV